MIQNVYHSLIYNKELFFIFLSRKRQKWCRWESNPSLRNSAETFQINYRNAPTALQHLLNLNYIQLMQYINIKLYFIVCILMFNQILKRTCYNNHLLISDDQYHNKNIRIKPKIKLYIHI